MVLMIVFLVLTIAFIIGTVIYLNYKKKNINSKINKVLLLKINPKVKRKLKNS